MAHACLLHDLLTAEILETVKKQKDLVSHGVTTFNYLWTLFIPGQSLSASVDGHDRIFNLASFEYETSSCSEVQYAVRTKYVEYDGSRMGYASKSFQVKSFGGTRQIKDLLIFPVSFHISVDELTEDLHKRGRLYNMYRGFYHKGYTGYVDFDLTSNDLMRCGPGMLMPPPPPPKGPMAPGMGNVANKAVPVRRWNSVSDTRTLTWKTD